jgi:Fur family peroxide stress response transcriptional regulator
MKQTSDKNGERLRAFKELSRKLGLKLTHQRLEIFKVLLSTTDHPSAEDVYEEVKKRVPPIAFDTVYRTLSLFERHGLLSKVNHLDGRTRYDPVTERHCHLICTRCRKIEDFTWPEVDQLRLPEETRRWGSIENKYIELRGLCQDCLKKDINSKASTYPNRNKEKTS